MYEGQVKLLRYCAEADCTECAVAGCPGPRKLLKDAADAIEELSKQLKKREDTSWAEWDVTCDPEYQDHFQKDEWGE